VTLIVVLALVGIVWWAVNAIPVPEPVRIVVIAAVAILAIVLLVRLLPGAGALWPTRP
jgi:hypothetical protein